MLTTDQDVVRKAARAMLQVALSCRDNMTNSGIAARVAGDAIDAKRPAEHGDREFLSCLSKAAIEKAAADEGVKIGSRGKDTRANLIERFKDRIYAYPARCSHRHRTKSPRPAATRATGPRASTRTTPALGTGRAPDAAATSVPRTSLTRVRAQIRRRPTTRRRGVRHQPRPAVRAGAPRLQGDPAMTYVTPAGALPAHRQHSLRPGCNCGSTAVGFAKPSLSGASASPNAGPMRCGL